MTAIDPGVKRPQHATNMDPSKEKPHRSSALGQREFLGRAKLIAQKKVRERDLEKASEEVKESLHDLTKLRIRGVSSWTKMKESFANAKKKEIDPLLYDFYGRDCFLNWKFKVFFFFFFFKK